MTKARKTNPGFTLDLSGANLAKTHLRGVDLKGSNLRDVGFTGADLPKADFLEADLRGAKLQGANLIGASLCRAGLTGVDLSGATLQSEEREDYASLWLYGGADLGVRNCRELTCRGYTWSAPR
jgi:uncharacterized protein YjbI with pentapeptide repeats